MKTLLPLKQKVEFTGWKNMSKMCKRCDIETDIKDMEMKMGGLLCPKCRVVLYTPYVDEEYFIEFRRRNKEREDVGTDRKTSQQGSD